MKNVNEDQLLSIISAPNGSPLVKFVGCLKWTIYIVTVLYAACEKIEKDINIDNWKLHSRDLI